ncbi:MAG: AMP-binding protein, partial [Alicyclobacillaceae bacterium]|nr:AMP-binding protein [Alicyclobacillaceae bacterium]
VSDIIFTSGTTGLPKGVMLTHDMFLRCAYSTTLSRAFEDGRRIFTPLPYYHVFAYVEGLLAVSFVGGAMISMPQFHPRQSLALMERYKATDFLCVPSMLVAILNHPERDQFDLSSLRALMCAAAPAPVPIWERAVRELGVEEICTAYGGTEATASTVHTEVGDPIEIIVTRVGRIKPAGSSGLPEFGGANVQYKVVDPFTGEDLPEGSVGELAVRGNTVTRGYYKKPEETAAAIDKDGWFRTGDLGRIDEKGYLEFLGRSKEMYKVSGENVSPKEVEEVISRHPAVNQVYVVGVPDPLTSEAGAAFIELKPGTTCTRREILHWCQERLAKFKIPRHIWFVEPGTWPMTGTGKIQKFRLQEIAKERLLQGTTAKEEGAE